MTYRGNKYYIGKWSEMHVKTPQKRQKCFVQFSMCGRQTHTLRHVYEALSKVIKFLRGKYRADSYWLQTVQHLTLYGFQAAKLLTLLDIADHLVWLQDIALNFWRSGQLFYSWLWWNCLSSSCIKSQIVVSLYPQQVFLQQIMDARNGEHVKIIFRKLSIF